MASRPFKLIVGLLVFGAGAAGIGVLTVENFQLRHRLARQREWTALTARMKEENRRLTGLLARAQTDDTGAVQSVHDELLAARREVAALEQRAMAQRGALVAHVEQDANDVANNRDPQRGLMRLEYFQDVGQATPAAALQTLTWAVMKNDGERLAAIVAIPPAARVKADALIASLPVEARAQWTPEKLAALYFSGALLDTSSLQMTSVKFEDASHATIALRAPGVRGEPKLPMELGPNGWRAVAAERAFDVVRKKMGQAPDPAK
jgi:hypothetical protein